MKYLPLITLMIVALGVGTVYAHTFDSSTVFLSDATGGQITFAQDFTAVTYTVADNQARFTVMVFNANGTFGSIGFRNPAAAATLQVTNIGRNYVAFDVTVAAPTNFEVWLPGVGEPDVVTGGLISTWTSPSLTITANANDSIVLMWTEDDISDTMTTGILGIVPWIALLLIAAILKHLGSGGKLDMAAVGLAFTIIVILAVISMIAGMGY